MKKNVLLIQPFRKPSLKEIMVKNYPCWEIINTSPLTLGAVMENGGYHVDFLNLQNIFKSFENNQLVEFYELLDEYIPDYVVFHTDYYIAFTSTAVFYSIKMISKFYKEKNKDIKIILIGRNGLALKERVFDIDPNIDIVVKGECEDSILAMLEASESDTLYNIPSIVYKINGVVKENEGCGCIKNIDNLPLPAFHLLYDTISKIEKYTGLTMKSLPVSIRTSFGCPMNCKYCGGISTWNNYYVKSKEYIAKEIDYFTQVFGDKGKILFFADELFAYKIEHVKDVADIFKRRGIKIAGLFAHSLFFTDELAKLIKCISDTVVFGGENCCDEVLVAANKTQTFESLMHAVNIAKNNGLNVSLEWIVGLPGETVETAARNINSLYSMVVTKKVDTINTYVYCPYPNTEFEFNAEKYGIMIHDSIDEMVEEGFPTYSLKGLTSNQIYVYYLLTQLVINMAQLDKEEIGGIFQPAESNLDRFEEIFYKVGENRKC